MHWEHMVSDVPKSSVTAIVTGSEQTIMEMMVTDILYFFLVKLELTQRVKLAAISLVVNVPHCQLTVKASTDHHVLLVRIPLDRVALSLMPSQHQTWRHLHSSCLKLCLIEHMNLAERCPGCNKVVLLGVSFDAVDLALMFNLMLDYHSVLKSIIVLPD